MTELFETDTTDAIKIALGMTLLMGGEPTETFTNVMSNSFPEQAEKLRGLQFCITTTKRDSINKDAEILFIDQDSKSLWVYDTAL